ncbi:ribonuclease III [Candidatus Woesebacteria bacterium]|nr:ribonuclease III [Candidatus Woesebacteria bacterium]
METNLNKLEKRIGITFKDQTLLRNVFVHRSYLNENREFELASNEKLEFLGDSVLSLTTSIYLYRRYSHLQEGDYTDIKASIVRTESLAAVAEDLELGTYLYLSHGEEKGKGRIKTNILADVFEALIAAIFIDQGFDEAYQFITTYLFADRLDHIVKNKLYLSPKSRLQEITQAEYKELPVYELVEAKGPEHKKTFSVKVLINGELRGEGVGKSKKQAEELAAQNALELLK